MYKKSFILIMVLALLLSMTSTNFTAYGASSPRVSLAKANAEALRLNQFGLLAGTGNGFALEEIPTRLQGIVMLIRMMGEESEAKACTYTHPFTDVPEWGDRYVAWAYHKNYTYGTSETTFSANDPMTAQQYLAFTLRALGYGEDTKFQTTIEDAIRFGLLSAQDYNDPSASFLRADMVHITYGALLANEKTTGQPFYLYLIAKGLMDPGITEEELANLTYEEPAGEEILPIPREFLGLPYYYADNLERYLSYKDKNPQLDFGKVILNVNIGLDKPFYTDIKTISQPNRIDVLVNKYNKLPDNFKPQLEEIPSTYNASGVGKQYLRKEAKDAFILMHKDAKKLGLKITAYGTYRSIQTQNDIWNRKVKSGRTIEDVDSLNARGGHSEHHNGLAIDVIRNDYTMEKTKEFSWIKDNAHKYGFIIRYPKGKESITGYAYEPWHLRYLGPELATKVYESGLTYEEYYAMHIEPTLK